MKTNRLWSIMMMLIFIIGTTIVFSSCSKNDKDEDKTETPTPVGVRKATTGDVEKLYCTAADVTGFIEADDNVLTNTQYGILCAKQSGISINKCDLQIKGEKIDNHKFTARLSFLEPSTRYFYRTYTCFDGNYVYGDEKELTTKDVEVITTIILQDGRHAIIECKSNLENFERFSDSNDKIDIGLVWGKESNLDIEHCTGSQEDYWLGQFETRGVIPQNLEHGSTYFYRTYTCLRNLASREKKYIYGEVKKLTVPQLAYVPSEAIDLGLSVKWAAYNVGATAPEGFGEFFAWGETNLKTLYNDNSYKWQNPFGETTKYNQADQKKNLDLADDAAHANWGGNWRIPTSTEMNELINHCTAQWTKVNGVAGCLMTSNINGNSIFLPAAGMRADGYDTYGFSYTATTCEYYTSTVAYNWNWYERALHMSCDSRMAEGEELSKPSVGPLGRYTGCSIRAVCH